MWVLLLTVYIVALLYMAAHYSGDTGEYCQLTWLQSSYCCSVVKIISSCRPLIQYVYCRRVSRGGGPKGPGPPPLEIEKQKKKKKKKVIRTNIKLFHLYFATFLVENFIFSANF